MGTVYTVKGVLKFLQQRTPSQTRFKELSDGGLPTRRFSSQVPTKQCELLSFKNLRKSKNSSQRENDTDSPPQYWIEINRMSLKSKNK